MSAFDHLWVLGGEKFLISWSSLRYAASTSKRLDHCYETEQSLQTFKSRHCLLVKFGGSKLGLGDRFSRTKDIVFLLNKYQYRTNPGPTGSWNKNVLRDPRVGARAFWKLSPYLWYVYCHRVFYWIHFIIFPLVRWVTKVSRK